ncbi:2100_t:CDS:2 [Acaulospora colombiana]|uniref:2100_t:CDS:1 n=1 Tax=Acaulospora colombiana TaxID=27376 RepID=A0ACA9MPV3_9GLOM|nr:2100_t:CDS:2 [Acaulospora colombiana]
MSVSEASQDSQSVQSNSEVNDSLNSLIGSDNFGEYSSHTQNPHSTEISPNAAMAFSILCDLLDECTLDVIFEVHRETKLATSICQICNTDDTEEDVQRIRKPCTIFYIQQSTSWPITNEEFAIERSEPDRRFKERMPF